MILASRVLDPQRGRGIVTPDSIPAPVGGWNTRDALADMQPTDAVFLDNWFPGEGQCTIRPGYTSHLTGHGGQAIKMLAEYHAGTTRKLIAAANGNLYDSTSGSPSSLGSGYSSDEWNYANFNGKIHFVNGADDPKLYDGTTLSSPSWSGSGLTISDLFIVHPFKNRLFFVETDSQDFWYAALDAESGTLTKFPLSRVSQFGGNLVNIGTLTIDGGSGPDDFICFSMSSGHVIVYQGTDPSDATAWSLVGIYNIAPSLGSRMSMKVGSDLMVGTTRDYVSMTDALRTGQLGRSSKISGAVKTAAKDNPSEFGWQMALNSAEGRMIVNVPNTDSTYDQHVLNINTGAWCRWKDIPAICWVEYNSELYFGSTDGTIYKMTGNDDAGAAIRADGRGAYVRLRTNALKRVPLYRMGVSAAGSFNYNSALGFDFKIGNVLAPTAVEAGGAEWDLAEWDVADWSDEEGIDLGWRVGAGVGTHVSPRIRISALQEVNWLRTDFRFEAGAGL